MTAREARRRWKKAIRKWQHALLLDGFAVNLVYEKPSPADSNATLPSENWSVIGRTEVKPMYLDSRITVDPDFIKEATDAEIDEKACHELVHVLLGRVDNFVNEMFGALPPSKHQGFVAWWHEVHEFTTTHIQRVAAAKA